jgi:CheY-like chemotaxis protein
MVETAMKTVAVFNSSDDTVEMLTMFLSEKGWHAVGGHADQVKSGEVDFIAFLETHKPDALIWDIAPPYDRNWRFFQLLRSIRALEDCTVVLTTTHKQHLDDLAGEATGAIEIIGKPYDLRTIVDAVTRKAPARLATGPRLVGGNS